MLGSSEVILSTCQLRVIKMILKDEMTEQERRKMHLIKCAASSKACPKSESVLLETFSLPFNTSECWSFLVFLSILASVISPQYMCMSVLPLIFFCRYDSAICFSNKLLITNYCYYKLLQVVTSYYKLLFVLMGAAYLDTSYKRRSVFADIFPRILQEWDNQGHKLVKRSIQHFKRICSGSFQSLRLDITEGYRDG